MILNLIRFPFAVVGQAADIFWQMRAHNRMVAALNEIQPETLNGRMPQEKDPAEVTAYGTASAGHPNFAGAAASLADGNSSADCGVFCKPSVREDKQRSDSSFDLNADPHSDSAASAVADSALTHPPVSADRPSSPNPPGAAGSHQELVELVAEVLAEHVLHIEGDSELEPWRFVCVGYGEYGGGEIHEAFQDRAGWRAHVAPLIAERIEKATPPAPFRFGDLGRAAQVINDYVATTVTDLTVTQMASLRNLADRLADAADADPTP